MNLLQQFVDFLLNQKPKRSLLTVKNYKADVGQFMGWFQKEFKLTFDPLIITLQTLEQYRKSSNLSASSMERHTSSLRKFFNFLKLEKIIFQNPLEKLTVSAEARALENPWMIKNFKSFLYECKKSNLTIKNYINDVKSFFVWFGEVALVKYSWNVTDRNLLDKINLSIIEEYKQRLIGAKFSPLTINRKLSSLRNYVGWAKSQGLIPPGHAEFISASQPEYVKNEILNRVQNDNVDYSSFPPERLMQKSLKGAASLFDNLFILPLAQTLQTIQYLFWKATGKKIFYKNVIPNLFRDPQHSNNEMLKSSQRTFLSGGGAVQHDNVRNIQREFYAPLSVSTRYFPAHKRIWHYIRHARPNWYKKYHSYSFTHYFHFAILTILSCAVGFGIYNGLFANTQKDNAVLGVSADIEPRILSFQGKLTNSADSPITKETAILFSLYDSENASSAVALWRESNTVKPDSDGAFSVLLGKKTPIPNTAFSQNSKLFLGITVGNSPELRPRQEIATVPFAGNSETLQGLEPITNTTKVSNVVLALDSSGNLNIAGAKAHTFQTIGGNLILSGKILSLTTVPGSNSNIEIVPDGLGKIDLQKPIQNSSNDNNLSGVPGAVEFADLVAILATNSAQSAFNINQNSTGGLISANTNEIAKFTVANDGTGLFAGDLEINGGDLISSNINFNLLNSTVTTLNIGGAATTINLGVSGGNTTIKSNLILSSLTSNGGILYTNGSGKIYQASAGSSSDCLTGGTTPSFTSCSKILNQASSVGIGTTAPSFKLDVQDLQDATAAAQIYNTSTSANADGLIIKLGNALPVNGMSSGSFVNFETAGVGTVGAILRNGDGTGVSYSTNGNADFAEYLKKDKNQTIEYGSVVCLKDNGLAVKCNPSSPSAGSGQGNIIGVASERPAFLGGQNLGNGSIAVGLIGQIETFAANLNGEIKAGDILTASDIPGVAVKATKAGQVIGKALEDLTTDESKVVGFYDPDTKEYRNKAGFPDIPLKENIIHVVKIHTLVNVSWYDPDIYLTSTGDLSINSDLVSQGEALQAQNYRLKTKTGEIIERIGAFAQIAVANLKAGYIKAEETLTQSLIITSDSIIVNGQNLKDYIVSVVGGQAGIISPVVNTNQLSANIISPLGESLIVRLATPSAEIHDSSFIIQNSSGSAVAKIDDQGNASFSGQLSSNTIATNDIYTDGLQAGSASISGTLRAGNILADSIEGLGAKISSYVDIASYSAQLSYVPDLSAERAQFNQGLMVFGPTSLSDLSVVGRLSIGGTMFITENSIETLGADLFFQSLRQGGLSIMGGLVYVDTEGNIKTQGNLSISGKLAVNNAEGISVLSVNQVGDVIASGSGTFTKLNFNLIAPVLAVSATEVIASSSAGIANIAPYQSEITIRNALVTGKSVIYITPVGTPSAQSPFLMRQIPEEPALNGAEGSFTVGVQSPTNHPLDFNWLIIN